LEIYQHGTTFFSSDPTALTEISFRPARPHQPASSQLPDIVRTSCTHFRKYCFGTKIRPRVPLPVGPDDHRSNRTYPSTSQDEIYWPSTVEYFLPFVHVRAYCASAGFPTNHYFIRPKFSYRMAAAITQPNPARSHLPTWAKYKVEALIPSSPPTLIMARVPSSAGRTPQHHPPSRQPTLLSSRNLTVSSTSSTGSSPHSTKGRRYLSWAESGTVSYHNHMPSHRINRAFVSCCRCW